MSFVVVTHVPHIKKGNTYFAYEPYVREMNIWGEYVDDIIIVAPLSNKKKQTIDSAYFHSNLKFVSIPSIEFTSIKKAINSLFKLPVILFKLFKSCQKANHIHLRCPGNIGLLGCMVQIFFPKKTKTAKYAGNWDPNAKQPLSYKLQKWILSNTFLTKNMQVLVYGNWENQSKNIKSFFTASFSNEERQGVIERDYKKALQFIFLGSLAEGKRPMLAIKIIAALKNEGKNVYLDVYGDGILKSDLKDYIEKNNLQEIITLHGNQEKTVIKKVLQEAHFLILPSKSEGWPKAVAEAMFFGTIPIATKISCVQNMLDYGKRGILIEPDLNKALEVVNHALEDEMVLRNMSKAASKWSQEYTLDVFENEISKLIKHS
jgi:glycosyltransferase involved in cell wall biosynthesis